MAVKSYRDLDVWQLAMVFVEEVYKLSLRFPASEKYALSDQLRRAAVSIPSNIAEGYGRGTPNEFARFLAFARGSLYEANTQLELASRLGYLNSKTGLYKMSTRLSKMLTSLAAKTRSRQKGGTIEHET